MKCFFFEFITSLSINEYFLGGENYLRENNLGICLYMVYIFLVYHFLITKTMGNTRKKNIHTLNTSKTTTYNKTHLHRQKKERKNPRQCEIFILEDRYVIV